MYYEENCVFSNPPPPDCMEHNKKIYNYGKVFHELQHEKI